jgi:hypothetical protein
MGHLFLT